MASSRHRRGVPPPPPLLLLLATPVAASLGGSPMRVNWRNIVGDACLPKDVVELLRGEAVEAVSKQCRGGGGHGSTCNAACAEAIYALKAERCYPYLTQSQTLQPAHAGVTLSGMAGIWYGLYPSPGVELVELRYNPSTQTLTATKLTGNRFVPAGKVSWEATPHGCQVVSSVWSGVYTPRWDDCSLTMWEDRMTLELGPGDDGLDFVRARHQPLLEWDNPRAPTYALAGHFEACGIEMVDSVASLFDQFRQWLHHSHRTVVLDQVLVCTPVVLVGGWQYASTEPLLKPILVVVIAIYCALLVARLQYLGIMS